jgi:hypothetical protein
MVPEVSVFSRAAPDSSPQAMPSLEDFDVVVNFKCTVKVEQILKFVVGAAAVDDSLPAGVDDDEGQVHGGAGLWRPVGLLLHLAVSLHKVP